MNFIGRETQKKIIQIFFNNKNDFAGLIYGRRRIGKTELIKNCLKESKLKSIYYECKQTSEINNTESFGEIISEVLGLPRLAFSGIEEALDFLFKNSSKETLIVVIDEYPYIRSLVKGLDSIIQNLIDKYKSSSKIKFILCGSYVDTMESLLVKQNPLFGRFDMIINLKQMDYFESSLFYKKFSNEDKVRLYSVFGGIPYYNRLIDSNKTVKENIINLIASPGCRLENEVTMYLESEIKKMNNANEVFEALANGYSKFSDILSQSNVTSSPSLVDILTKLIKMEVVKKEAPINDENNKKKAKYYIDDALSYFYFKYIFKNFSRINVMESKTFFNKFIQKDFEEQYVPHAFENICKQFLILKNKSGELENSFEKIGKYYYDLPEEKNNGEFDIVTESDSQFIFYEAKFRNDPVSESMIYNEIKQVNKCGLSCEKYGFFSKSGYGKIKSENKKNLILYKLDDLYK